MKDILLLVLSSKDLARYTPSSSVWVCTWVVFCPITFHTWICKGSLQPISSCGNKSVCKVYSTNSFTSTNQFIWWNKWVHVSKWIGRLFQEHFLCHKCNWFSDFSSWLQLENSPFHYESHLKLIQALRDIGDLDKTRQARETMCKMFPLTPGTICHTFCIYCPWLITKCT